MPIAAAELKTYRSTTVSDAAANGGRMSANEAVSGVKNSVWPDVPEAERTAGSTKYRKLFRKVENDADLAGQLGKLRVTDQSPGDDRILIFPGAQRDTQGNLTGSERLYGCGDLGADVAAAATAIVVNAEAAADAIYQDGDEIWIGDGTNEEYINLAATGAVAWNGDQATLTLAAGLANSYLAAAPTKVASVIATGNIQGSSDNYAVTSTAGAFDDAGNPVTVDHIGGVEETVTVSFTSATDFTVTGDTLGALGSGSTAAAFSPNNPNFSKPYFTLPAAGWGGTWANGDTLVFQVHPAAFPYWEKRIVPAGSANLAANGRTVSLRVESA